MGFSWLHHFPPDIPPKNLLKNLLKLKPPAEVTKEMLMKWALLDIRVQLTLTITQSTLKPWTLEITSFMIQGFTPDPDWFNLESPIQEPKQKRYSNTPQINNKSIHIPTFSVKFKHYPSTSVEFMLSAFHSFNFNL